jgi:hypothetical protein
MKPLGSRAGFAARLLAAALVAILGLYTLLVGALEVFAGTRLAYSWWLVLVAAVNLLFFVPHAVTASDIVRRRSRGRELMLWLAVVGFLWCLFRSFVLGSAVQIALTPLYLLLGGLAIGGRSVFSPPAGMETQPPRVPPTPHPERHRRAKTPPSCDQGRWTLP